MRTSISTAYRNHSEALLAGAVGFTATAMIMLALSLFFA